MLCIRIDNEVLGGLQGTRYSKQEKIMDERSFNQISPKMILPRRLEEFRTALEEEIICARADAFGHTVPLTSGRKISHTGKSCQYVFRLKDTFSLPDDTPGDLYIKNLQPVAVTIVAIDGMSIIISCQNDLGEFIPEARLLSDLTFLLRKLIERIEELSGISNIVGDRILSNSFVDAHINPIKHQGLNERQQNKNQPNKRQFAAIQSSLERNLTFIWGPPGTGKTETIGFIGSRLRKENRSLLILSHTNTAVDQAILKIAKENTESLEEGKILRVGIPKDNRIREEYPNIMLETHVERRSNELSNRLLSYRKELEESKENLKNLTHDIELYDWFSIAKNDLNDMREKKDYLLKIETELDDARKRYVEMKNKIAYWEKSKIAAQNAKKNIAQIEQLDSQIIRVSSKVIQYSSEKNQILQILKNAKRVLHETQSVNWIIRMWRSLPSPEDQEMHVEELQSKLKRISVNLDNLENELQSIKVSREQTKDELSEFNENYSDAPDVILRKEEVFRQDIDLLVNYGKSLVNEYKGIKINLTRYFLDKLLVIQKLGFGTKSRGSVYELYEIIQESFHKVQSYIEPIDIKKSRKKLQSTFEQINQIEVEIAKIEEALSRVEEVIISEAEVIATTLTKAYLNNAVRSRRYDTLVVDEASMAPIPAIWVAASVVENNAVIVGDHQQLPPIVTSSTDLSKKWLGRDIFAVAGVVESKPDNFIQLNEQYRMHPCIANIPNQLFYDKSWVNKYSNNEEGSFSTWYKLNWGNDAPVLLIDTGSLNAWVTSVPRGRGSSRLNFLSATLCIDICNILLKKNRPKRLINSGERRIFILCPYQPHAKFLNILLEENKLIDDVEVGTIHAFQGSEAEVVIFDLVNDEPHWRVGLFMQANDASTKKLINVGVTRARRRLFVVGDFSYIEGLSKKAFLGQKFIPFLKENYPIKNALDVAPLNILTRAAKASRLISKGNIESDSSRIIVTQDDFYPLLLNDIDTANTRVVIYSPFITRNRMSELQPTFLSAISKGVRIFLVTKPLQERGKRSEEEFRYMEHTLENWGATVIHKRGMHEKLVIIDDNILWSGSLNPLSYSDTQEIMERRVSKKIIQEYSQIIRLDKLVEEFIENPPKCPICESEMIASEGRDDPFYWRCVVDDCYSRSIDQPQIHGGKIVCATCGGVVEFGIWGKKPAWRCIENRHHHQRMIRNHLKLPKMRNIISQEQLTELLNYFGEPISK